MAKLINPEYEELTASGCISLLQSSLGRYKCGRTGKIVIGTEGRATVTAMRCQ